MKKSRTGYYITIFISICALLYIYQAIRDRWLENCQNKYSFSYNMKRKKLGIPVIPSSWHIKERDPKFIWWTGNENVIGHKRKTIAFLACEISSELDVYTLPSQNGKERWLEIEYKYGIKSHKDSIAYTYQIEHSAKEISKNIADSIFNAENINKDY